MTISLRQWAGMEEKKREKGKERTDAGRRKGGRGKEGEREREN